MKRWFWQLAILFLAARAIAPQSGEIFTGARPPLDSITVNSLRGNLSFLASDRLAGRDTPSLGLDIAAVYIAAQFRGAGLDPAAADYLQTAAMFRLGACERCDLRIKSGPRTLALKSGVSVVATRPLRISDAPVYRIADGAPMPAAARGRVVIAPEGMVLSEQPAAIIEIPGTGDASLPRLIDADEQQRKYGGIPRLLVSDDEALKVLRGAPLGETGISIDIVIPSPTAVPISVSNVAAILRGSDAALRNQYILLSAHYDHLGRDNDGILYPGANDDASGTVSVIEIARTLARMPVHPRRSILFLAFFGEEEGSLGSKYYVAHPLVPLAKTVADLNLEQLGRTDSTNGPEVANATLTGFDFSSLPHTLQQAGALTGVIVYDTPHGDDYFDRSDNRTFAEIGIPAHTLAVALEFPDYHAAGDTWKKIDYANLAKVDRMIALGLVMLADSADAPRWNRANPKVAPYLK